MVIIFFLFFRSLGIGLCYGPLHAIGTLSSFTSEKPYIILLNESNISRYYIAEGQNSQRSSPKGKSGPRPR
jgi:hypothetical protein